MLSIESHEDGSRHTLLLRGELDVASAPELEARVQQLSVEGPGELVLDLGGLEFIDPAGLNAILRVRALCQEQMWEFCLMPGERRAQRLFEITRLVDRLPFRKPRRGERGGGARQASPADVDSEH
jgi:anti-sigma B factor antagonist